VRLLKFVHLPPAYATDDGFVSSFLQLCFGIYLFLMLRRCYGVTRWYGLLTASLIAWSFFHIVWLYRYFLFEVTMSVV